MGARWELASPGARARGHAGNHRLHDRWIGFMERRKKPIIANVALARELAEWCWSLVVMDEQPNPRADPSIGAGWRRVE
jgi:transposase